MGSQDVSKHPPLCKPLLRLDALAPLPPPSPLSENPKPPTANPNPSPDLIPTSPSHSASSTSPLRDHADDPPLINADVLSGEEVLRRRYRRLKRLERCYMEQYWALVEDLREKHREYYWNHGVSPVVVEEGAEPVAPRSKCAFSGCKTNAMPLTRFCHAHILSDRDQTLYKPCTYALKSGHSGPINCGKPVLRAAVPSLCPAHFQRAQKHIAHALKKAGLSTSCSTRPAPKFHVLIAEYVNQIQAKRRGASTAEADRIVG